MSVDILVRALPLRANCVGASVSGRTDASDGKPPRPLDAHPSVALMARSSAPVGRIEKARIVQRLVIPYLRSTARTLSSGIASTVRPLAVTLVAMNIEL